MTADGRAILAAVLAKQLPQLESIIEETRHGIEIEKTMPDGTVVVGRFNADASKAGALILNAAEFCFPKLARQDKTLEGYTDAELLAELERREKVAAKASAHPAPAETAGTVQ